MYFQQIILRIIQKYNGERSSTAPFYLLKGKKSGQTIQDVNYFNLHAFYSIYPKLSKEVYDEEIKELITKQLIEMKDTAICLTEKGKGQIQSIRNPLYNGWLYRGNEHIFWSRVELIVQTLSYFQASEKRFVPNQKNQSIHQFVKNYLRQRNFQFPIFQRQFKQQLMRLLDSPAFERIHKELFVYRLSGYENSGLTWDQLARRYNYQMIDVKLLFIESLHVALSSINEEQFPDLYELMKDVEVITPLTDSAMKTFQLVNKGYSMQEIADIRMLKINTIEDHIIEIVSANQKFPVSTFISTDQVQKVLHVSRKLQTKKLTNIRANIPELSFFQIKIALSIGGGEEHG